MPLCFPASGYLLFFCLSASLSLLLPTCIIFFLLLSASASFSLQSEPFNSLVKFRKAFSVTLRSCHLLLFCHWCEFRLSVSHRYSDTFAASNLNLPRQTSQPLQFLPRRVPSCCDILAKICRVELSLPWQNLQNFRKFHF